MADEEVAIIYHADADGVTAAAFAGYLLQCHNPELRLRFYSVGTAEFDFSLLKQTLRLATPDHVLCLDINLESVKGTTMEVASLPKRSFLLYDDHVAGQLTLKPGSMYLNPSVSGDPNLPLPACFFMYQALAREHPRYAANSAEWILQVGLMGENVHDIYSRHNKLSQIDQQSLRTVVGWIYAYYSQLDRPHEDDTCIRFLTRALAHRLTLDESISSNDREQQELRRLAKTVDRCVELEVSRARSMQSIARVSGVQVAIFETSGEFYIVNLIASRLRNLIHSGISIVYQNLNERILVELRRTRDLADINLAEILNSVSLSVPMLNHGGHPPAAGGAIPIGSFNEFHEALLRQLEGSLVER